MRLCICRGRTRWGIKIGESGGFGSVVVAAAERLAAGLVALLEF